MSVSQEFDSSSSGSDITLDGWNERYPASFSDERWNDEDFNDFMNALVYPKKVVKSERVIRLLNTQLSRTKDWQVDIDLFDFWHNQMLDETQYEENDRYDLETWLPLILGAWMSVSSKLKAEEPSCTCKKGVENIIELAFQLRAGADQVWQQMAELVLPDDPDSIVADSITTMGLPPLWRLMLSTEFRCVHPFSWSYSNKPNSTVTFVFAASEDDSDSVSVSEKSVRDRLQKCFFSAQMHRRALCFTDGPIFGATLCGGTFRIYVSLWENGTLVIRPILKHFAFETFFSFLECYFALCRLSEYQSRWLQTEFDRWEAEFECHLENLRSASLRPWRSKARDEIEYNYPDIDDIGINDRNDTAGINVSALERVRNRKARLLLKSILREPYSRESGYRLTRKHKKAFDIVTELENTETMHSCYSPTVWVEETYKHRGAFENPPPFCYDQVEVGDTPMDWSRSEESTDESSKELLPGETKENIATPICDVFAPRGDGANHLLPRVDHTIANVRIPHSWRTRHVNRRRRAHSDVMVLVPECTDVRVC